MFSLFIANALGWLSANKKLVLWFGVGLVVLIAFGYLMQSCDRPNVKIDQNEINKINSANERERKEALQQVFDKVDDTRAVSDEKRAKIIQKVEEAKQTKGNVTAEELEKLFESEK